MYIYVVLKVNFSSDSWEIYSLHPDMSTHVPETVCDSAANVYSLVQLDI